MEVPTAPTIEELELQFILDRERRALELVSQNENAKSWFGGPTIATETGTDKLYELLEHRVEDDTFTALLENERRRVSDTPQPLTPERLQGRECLNEDWWQLKHEQDGDTMVAESTGDYVLIDHDDVVNALASFIAAYLVTLPEAQSMKAQDLQKAVRQTLKELRKGKVRRLLDWGRYLYRAAALSYGAFAAYTNPWIAEGVLRAIWTCMRFARAAW